MPIEYTVLIAPVRVHNLVTLQQPNRDRYCARVKREKDHISFASPPAPASPGNALDLSRFRHSDNRGPLRPRFVVPFQVSFENTTTNKRTVHILVEKERQSMMQEPVVVGEALLDLLVLLPRESLAASLQQLDEAGDNDSTAAAAALASAPSAVFSDFSVPIRPVFPPDSASSNTLSLLGRRSLVDIDIVMFPSRQRCPGWPLPMLPDSPTMTTTGRRSTSTSSSSPRRRQPTQSTSTATTAATNSASAVASAAATIPEAVQAPFSPALATVVEQHGGGSSRSNAASAQPPQQQEQQHRPVGAVEAVAIASTAAHQHSALVPADIRRSMNHALDSLQQIQELRKTVTQLTQEVASLEQRAAGAAAASQQQQQQPPSSSDFAVASTVIDPSAVAGDSASPAVEDLLEMLRSETQMMVQDTVEREEQSSLLASAAKEVCNDDDDDDDADDSALRDARNAALLFDQLFVASRAAALETTHPQQQQHLPASHPRISALVDHLFAADDGRARMLKKKLHKEKQLMAAVAVTSCIEEIGAQLDRLNSGGGDLFALNLPSVDDVCARLCSSLPSGR